MLNELIDQLSRSQDLADEQVAEAVQSLASESVSAGRKAEFLTALSRKGESSAEIAAFARALRAKSLRPVLDPETRAREILDVCGTGGDRLNTFNISTTVALVVASAGVTVAKHGNRAITSRSGSADVLEALGIRIDLSPEEAARSLRDHQFAFFFAPRYHPAFRHIGPARQICAERGQRTVFNFLGPLLNPADPTAQLVGVPRPQLCEPVARVLQALGLRRAMVVCGQVRAAALPPESAPAPASGPPSVFLDELSTLGENSVAEFYQDCGFSLSTLALDGFELQPAQLADLAGGDRDANAQIVIALLEGRERGPKRDIVLLNAGAALLVAGRVHSMTEGFHLARELIDSGRGLAKLKALRGSTVGI